MSATKKTAKAVVPMPRASDGGYVDYHTKQQVNLRLSDEAVEILDTLQGLYGIGRADVVEQALRKLLLSERRAGNL